MSTSRNAQELARELLGRPLSARSVIASLLLGRHPPKATAALLVRWCGLFDISEGAARVALSRMTASGELIAAAATYELAGPVRARQAEQDLALAGPGRWDGTWVLYVARPGARTAADRRAWRDEARRLRLGELREGVWARPDNLDRRDGSGALATADVWRGGLGGDAMEVAGRLFPRAPLERHAVMVIESLDAVRTRLDRAMAAGSLATAFVVGAAALRLLRQDPLLPAELEEASWPAGPLRAAYHGYQGPFDRAVRTWWGSAPGSNGP